MKHILNCLTLILIAGVCGLPAAASELTIPNSFSAGSPAVAAEVNDNFTATSDAVNDNDARISTNEMAITDNSDAISQLTMTDSVAYQPSLNNNIFVNATDTIVKSLTISAPVDGHAIITFNSWFICTGGTTCVPRCSVNEGGTSINTTNFTINTVPPTSSANYGPMVLTTALPLAAGDHAINVVCDCFSGQGSFGDMSLIAAFSASNITGT